MKLSQLTKQDKIKLAAELDGCGIPWQHPLTNLWQYDNQDGKDILVRPYATSYDAIIPLIQKQPKETLRKFYQIISQPEIICSGIHSNPFLIWLMELKATPSQLLDAFLVATGKAEL